MSNMTIKVDFLAGTSVRQAIAEAKQKAIDLDVAYIVFDFNGSTISVRKHTDVDEAVDDFFKHDSKHIIA